MITTNRSAREPLGVTARIAQGSVTAAIIVIGTLAVGACGGDSDDTTTSLPMLLSADQLGDGWVESDPGDVALLPGTVAPTCPFEGEIPDIEIAAADSVEFGDEARHLGINHTVVELNGDAAAARAVLDTWATMDCFASDAVQRPVEGLPEEVFGVELDTIDSDFTQAVLIRVDGSMMSFLVVTGDGDSPIDLARELAPLL